MNAIDWRMLDIWLEETAWNKLYWSDVRERARELKSDGCTGVPDWLIWTCWEHDIHYRTHKMLSGREIDKRTADYIYRVRIQQGSALAGIGLGFLSPVAWWRWAYLHFSPRASRNWEKNKEACNK